MPVSELVIISQDADPDAAPGETLVVPRCESGQLERTTPVKDLIVDTANKADEIGHCSQRKPVYFYRRTDENDPRLWTSNRQSRLI